jgi:hypothetical protein
MGIISMTAVLEHLLHKVNGMTAKIEPDNETIVIRLSGETWDIALGDEDDRLTDHVSAAWTGWREALQQFCLRHGLIQGHYHVAVNGQVVE